MSDLSFEVAWRDELLSALSALSQEARFVDPRHPHHLDALDEVRDALAQFADAQQQQQQQQQQMAPARAGGEGLRQRSRRLSTEGRQLMQTSQAAPPPSPSPTAVHHQPRGKSRGEGFRGVNENTFDAERWDREHAAGGDGGSGRGRGEEEDTDDATEDEEDGRATESRRRNRRRPDTSRRASTPSTIASAVAGLTRNLSSLDGDWNVRRDAIQRLHNLMAEQHDPSVFTNGLNKELALALSVQIGDLRSQIVRDVCRTIMAITAVGGSEASPFVRRIFRSTLEVAGGANKVMAGYAMEALNVALANCTCPKVLLQILKLTHTFRGSKPKLAVLAQCVLSACKNWDEDSLHEAAPTTLLDILAHLVGCPSGPARLTARQAYAALNDILPSDVAHMVDRLEHR